TDSKLCSTQRSLPSISVVIMTSVVRQNQFKAF
ncbi:hypothetical protein GCK32_018953, partial [Trichostrongylus colubriformis]